MVQVMFRLKNEGPPSKS